WARADSLPIAARTRWHDRHDPAALFAQATAAKLFFPGPLFVGHVPTRQRSTGGAAVARFFAIVRTRAATGGPRRWRRCDFRLRVVGGFRRRDQAIACVLLDRFRRDVCAAVLHVGSGNV